MYAQLITGDTTMADGTHYKHDASDKKLDHAATEAADAVKDTAVAHANGPGHDPAKIARHDDAGKDRLFEHREQHDDAEKESERLRLAKDVTKHDHPSGDVTPAV